jgi:hypothetical protein
VLVVDDNEDHPARLRIFGHQRGEVVVLAGANRDAALNRYAILGSEPSWDSSRLPSHMLPNRTA